MALPAVPEDYNEIQKNQRAPPPPRRSNRAPPRKNHRDPPAYRDDTDAPAQWDYRDLPQKDDAGAPPQRDRRVSPERDDAGAPPQRDQRASPPRDVAGGRGGAARQRGPVELEQPLRVARAVVVDDPAYLVTEEYPFTTEQFDAQKEKLLTGLDPAQLALNQELPQMNPNSKDLLDLAPDVARNLEALDLECAGKHMAAIKDSVATHDDLHDFVLMSGERPVHVLHLAGLENAPGLFDDVTQRCRVVFTNQKRLVFTQAKHSAEVGVPQTTCFASMLICFQDQWSRRRWTSFCAAIDASQILQVFVQQTLTTSYQTSNCTFNDVFGKVFCTVGGTMFSEKDVDGDTQMLGDHDPGKMMSRWNRTRFMRHALVIRYLDCASNSVRQTIAMAHPSTPTSKLYEMARSIEANITLGTAEWLKSNKSPTALPATPFVNQPPLPPLFKRTAYKQLMLVLFVVALLTFAVNPVAAFFMLIAVIASVLGSYSSMNSQSGSPTRGKLSNIMIGAQSGAGLVYAFFLSQSARAFSSMFSGEA